MRRILVSISVAITMLAIAPLSRGAVDASSGWSGSALPQPSASVVPVVGIAAGPDGLVAIGSMTCAEPRSDGAARCWGQVWTSPDGSTWRALDARTAGIDLGYSLPRTSGPEPGLAGVAYGASGFVAFGRAQATLRGREVSAVWRSADGEHWQRVPTGRVFDPATRLRSILGASDGYLLGGVVYGDHAPRAVIWSSPDGLKWTRGVGSGSFDIGGYVNTLEDPAAGGVNAFALYPASSDGGSLADGAVAVGQGCMGSIDGTSIWAFNGTCLAFQWQSADSTTWTRGDMPPVFGQVSTVATSGSRIVVGAPVCPDCASAMLVSDNGSAWQVAYGSPVGGRLVDLVAAAGRFYALLAVSHSDAVPGESLVVWSSEDGTNWQLEDSQPTLPVTITSLHQVDMSAAGTHLLISVSGEMEASPGFVSVAMIGPALT